MHKLTIYKTDGSKEVRTMQEKPTLEMLQGIVGGNIELVSAPFFADLDWFKRDHANVLEGLNSDNYEDFAVWCDEEGKLADKDPNQHFPALPYDQIVGDVIVQEVTA